MTLKEKYDNLILTGEYSLTKQEFNKLNDLHKEKFHKNIKRDCGDCARRALIAVFGEQPMKMKQTFPKHEPTEETAKSELYATLGEGSSIIYFANITHRIKQAALKLKQPIESAIQYKCFKGAYINEMQKRSIDAFGYDKRADAKAYKDFTKRSGVSKTFPKTDKEIDLLIFLVGKKTELKKLIEKHKPKFVHTHLELDNPIKIVPTLPEGTLYKI